MGTGVSIMDSSIWVATTTGRPAARHSRTIAFCTLGTRSGGSSTPRSPRATITASERATISPRRSSAAGFSSLTMIAARPSMRRRSSVTSWGRWMKEGATQSTPSSRPTLRSCSSFLVKGDSGSTTSGTFTPLLSDREPPVLTRVSAKLAPEAFTDIRMRPSSSSSSTPGRSAANTSGCGNRTRSSLPGASSRSSRKVRPSRRWILPSSKRPMRSLGPWRSSSAAVGRRV